MWPLRVQCASTHVQPSVTSIVGPAVTLAGVCACAVQPALNKLSEANNTNLILTPVAKATYIISLSSPFYSIISKLCSNFRYKHMHMLLVRLQGRQFLLGNDDLRAHQFLLKSLSQPDKAHHLRYRSQFP